VKRDMDLIREILLKVEADPTSDGSHFVTYGPSDFEGHSQREISYHVDLLLSLSSSSVRPISMQLQPYPGSLGRVTNLSRILAIPASGRA
jgi:Hypothetical protein (DUF2513)